MSASGSHVISGILQEHPHFSVFKKSASQQSLEEVLAQGEEDLILDQLASQSSRSNTSEENSFHLSANSLQFDSSTSDPRHRIPSPQVVFSPLGIASPLLALHDDDDAADKKHTPTTVQDSNKKTILRSAGTTPGTGKSVRFTQSTRTASPQPGHQTFLEKLQAAIPSPDNSASSSLALLSPPLASETSPLHQTATMASNEESNLFETSAPCLSASTASTVVRYPDSTPIIVTASSTSYRKSESLRSVLIRSQSTVDDLGRLNTSSTSTSTSTSSSIESASTSTATTLRQSVDSAQDEEDEAVQASLLANGHSSDLSRLSSELDKVLHDAPFDAVDHRLQLGLSPISERVIT